MNKNTKVLALKYRPQVFEDLIGQNIAAETIFNSIRANKLPNAYLFTGRSEEHTSELQSQ